MSSEDRKFMALAIQLAEKGRYTTDPNPCVGCVLVKNGSIIGSGWHQRAGEPHAEINALADAKGRGASVVGATAYVTLEPCSHHGKTPPCANALVEAKVAKVVIGMQDPNPLVSGNGVKRLQEVGIEVVGPILEEEAKSLNPGFIKRMQTGRPRVCCKMAMSVDGRTAMASGESKWITGPAARGDVQKMRARSSAIVTGIGTVLTDDPSLTLRQEELGWAPERHPARVILDRELRISDGAKVLQGSGDIYIVTPLTVLQKNQERVKQLVDRGVTFIDVAERDELSELLDELGKLGFNEIMVEAGATVAGAFVEQGLVDEIVIYMAPTLMGCSARPLLNVDIASMSDKVNLKIEEIVSVGCDWRIIARPI